MAKGKLISKLINLLLWVTGVLVSLAVGFGMIDGVLTIKWVPSVLAVFAGWVVVILTVLGVVLRIVENFR